ncbi:hypothetical protein OSTOST_25479, partial [Ostertagia ostertagi]
MNKSLFTDDLIVRNPTSDDVGIYECQAISAAGVNTDAAKAFVAVAPRVELKQSKSIVKKGDSVSFECKILEATPAPQVNWFRGGKELLRSDNGHMAITGTHLLIN